MTPTSVVITGASTGIGQACALHLDRRGFRVFAGVRRVSDGESLRKQASDRLTPLLIDVADPQAIHHAAASVASELGSEGLSGLVNNAGITGSGPLEYLPIEILRQVLDVNVVGLLATTQAFLPLLRTARGRVVIMGSITGIVSLPIAGAYCASKAAVESIGDVLRVELRPAGIAVSIVEPGSIKTPIWNKGIDRVNEMVDSFPEHTRAQLRIRYGSMLDAAYKGASRQNTIGSEPLDVAKAVEHALTARRPSVRYVIGRDARMLLLLNLLPVRLLDRIRARMFGQRV